MLIVRVLLRPYRRPASRIAWVVVITSLPIVGILTYLLVWRGGIGRRMVARRREVVSNILRLAAVTSVDEDKQNVALPEQYSDSG